MGRLNHDQEQFFYSFRLDEAVPEDHPVREIAAVLDLSWVHCELASYYPKLGRPSIDPALILAFSSAATRAAAQGCFRKHVKRFAESCDHLAFLAVSVRAMLARRVLEIGTSNGYSTLWLASAARAIGGSAVRRSEEDIDEPPGLSKAAATGIIKSRALVFAANAARDPASRQRGLANRCWQLRRRRCRRENPARYRAGR